MTRAELNQYRSLIKEEPKLQREIDRLYKRLDKVPTVSGKVMKSEEQFPYVLQHVTVEMEEPKQATEIRKQIQLKESTLDSVESLKTQIEQFIANIEDSTARQVISYIFVDGKTQEETARLLNYTQSSISKIVKAITRES